MRFDDDDDDEQLETADDLAALRSAAATVLTSTPAKSATAHRGAYHVGRHERLNKASTMLPARKPPIKQHKPEPREPKTVGEKFLFAFGERGGVWFAMGLSFEQAIKLWETEQMDRLDRLIQENADLKRALCGETSNRGEAAPVTFGGSAGKVNSTDAMKFGNRPGLARFAAAIKLPAPIAEQALL